MKKINKTVVFIFGEYRTFNYIAPYWDCLDKDKFDIFIFSPNQTRWLYKNIRTVSVDDFTKVIPHANIKLHKFHSESFDSSFLYYWKEFKNILEFNEYKNVIISRVDSTLFINSLEFSENNIYSDREGLDCLFYGNYNMMKCYINDFCNYKFHKINKSKDEIMSEILIKKYNPIFSIDTNPIFSIFYRENMVSEFLEFKSKNDFKPSFMDFYKSGKWENINLDFQAIKKSNQIG
tara:strand:+ start:59 stop:760 length:702 start_codon:yes stop_codon:yes gene_type:complete